MSCNHPYELSGEQCICKHPYKLSDQGECSECEKGFRREIDQSKKEIICSMKVSFENVKESVKKSSGNITMIDAARFCQCNSNTGLAATGLNCTKENNYQCSS